MKKVNLNSIQDLVDSLDTNKGSQYYNLSKVRKDKKKQEGETWVENSTEYIFEGGIVQTKKSKMLEEELQDIKLPRFCPKCNKQIKHQLDIDSWWINNQCYDCFIKEDNKLRLKSNYKDIENSKNRVETLALLKAELNHYRGLKNSIRDKLRLVQNSEGLIDEWTLDPKAIKSAIEDYDKKIEGIEKYIVMIQEEEEKWRALKK